MIYGGLVFSVHVVYAPMISYYFFGFDFDFGLYLLMLFVPQID
jgi:hypothetical protein